MRKPKDKKLNEKLVKLILVYMHLEVHTRPEFSMPLHFLKL